MLKTLFTLFFQSNKILNKSFIKNFKIYFEIK